MNRLFWPNVTGKSPRFFGLGLSVLTVAPVF